LKRQKKGVVMNAKSTARRRAELTDEVSKWTVGAGIITVALFPLAIPIVVLTAVALLPLLVPLAAIGLLAGVVALPVMVVRRLRGRRKSGPVAEEEMLVGVELAPLHR
jgi:membrane protein implicated in regulation of membrane protease activity